MSETKICVDCNEEKELTEFYSQRVKKKDGTIRVAYQPYCKPCSSKRVSKRNNENREEYLQYQREYSKEYMESPYRREYHRAIVRQRTENGKNKQWQQENPDRMRGYRIKREMHKTHTISNREWEDCKKYFNHRCAYCGLKIEEHFTKYKGVEKLGDFHKEHVDHSGANDLSNCVPACRTCNSLKNVFELEDWYNKTNDNFDQDRLEKIHKWLNEDYLKYIEKVRKIN